MYTSLKPNHSRAGFTLAEVMTSLAILSLVITAAALAYTMSIRIWRTASARIDASSSASTALTRCTMGAGSGFGLRAAFRPVLITSNDDNWQIRFTTPAGMSGDATTTNALSYDAAARTITYQSGGEAPTIIGRNIIESPVPLQTSDAITITVRAQARTGYTNVIREMSTAITPRNRS